MNRNPIFGKVILKQKIILYFVNSNLLYNNNYDTLYNYFHKTLKEMDLQIKTLENDTRLESNHHV